MHVNIIQIHVTASNGSNLSVIALIYLQQKMKGPQNEADKTSMAGGEAREESCADTPSEPALAFTLKKRSALGNASVPGNTCITRTKVKKSCHSDRLLDYPFSLTGFV